MDARDLVELGARRLAPLEPGELLPAEGRPNRAQPVGGLRVIAAGIVLQAGLMAIEQRGHRPSCLSLQFCTSTPASAMRIVRLAAPRRGRQYRRRRKGADSQSETRTGVGEAQA